MAETTIRLNITTIIAIILIVAALLLLIVVGANAYLLASGNANPLMINTSELLGRTTTTSAEIDILFGILLQTGMYAVLVGIAYVVLYFSVGLLHKPRTP